MLSFSYAFSQEIRKTQDLDEAIKNVKKLNYDLAIPVLKKYSEMKGFDDFKTLEITIYLNWCYYARKDEALDIEKVNSLTEGYISKYGISKTNVLKSKDEMGLLFYSGVINIASGKNEKMVNYFTLIKNKYEEENLANDDGLYAQVLMLLTRGFYNLKDYESAIKTGQKAWDANKDLFGEKNDASLEILDLLYLSCKKNKQLDKSLEYLNKEVGIGIEFLGEENPKYIGILNELAIFYSNLGNYQKSLEIKLKVVELNKKVFGENDPDYLTSLSNLAIVYFKIGNYQKALEINLDVAKERKIILGEKDPDYLMGLSNLATVYFNMGDYNKALAINLQVSSLLKEVLGDTNPRYLTSLSNLAYVYSSLGNYEEALEINQKVVEVQKNMLGEKNPDYLTSLQNLAAVYVHIGDYQKALEIAFKVVESRKELLGEKNPDYLTSLGGLTSVLIHLGDYKKALEISLRLVELRKEILGERNHEYLKSLGTLATIYLYLGDYPKALEINLRDIELLKEVLGDKHPDYFTSSTNLALIYSYLGDYKKALEINLEVVEIQKEILGEKNPNYLVSLNNLALLYSQLGNYNKALEIDLKVVELSKVVLGETNPGYLTSLANLAVVYSDLGSFQKALEIKLKVAEMRKVILGEKHPDYIVGLGNLASDYSNLGDYKKALEINLQVAKSFKEVLGEKHPDYITCLIDLAVTEFHLSETNSALNYYLQMVNIIKKMVTEYFSSMTEYQREQYWKKYSRYFTRFPLFFEKAANSQPETAIDAYNNALFSKGLLLNTTIDFHNLLTEKGTLEAIAKFEELKLLKSEIQRLTEKPIAERYLNVDSLENIAQLKETELVKLSKEYGDYTGNLKINWKDVQANLQDKDVAIEFVEYPTLTDTVKYAALVLRKGWQYPRMISLFRKDQVDDFIKQDKDVIYSKYVGKELKKLIWSPLEQVVSPGERVYFSPAGIIHKLAIENLPFDDSTTLGDRYQMYRLSSTKELALHKAESKSNIAALYGGLQYDLPEEKMMAESKKYEMQETLYAMRGYTNDTAVRSGWKYLDGTKPEVDKISQLMKDKHYQVNEYSGAMGNEESFKALSGKKDGIIHIATHGFFLPIEESRKNDFIMQRMGDQQQERATVDPMLRSGLIMAGGNKAWQGEKIPDNIEDGVLTAKEISRMDLRGTDLVVLSACETGLGEVSSEGVFGLQRSFKQAGVQTLVMSLWQVNDEATRYLMTEFYLGLLSGKGKREAFLEAKQKCKVKYTEPRYWSAFIMLD